MNRVLLRPGPRAAVLTLCALGLVALTACGAAQQPPGLVLESMTPAPQPTPAPSGSAPERETCFAVASAHTALILVPLSTDESDPRFDPEAAATSVRELAARLPAGLRPSLDDAVTALGAAGDSVQPVELAQLQRALAPVGDWLRQHCADPAG